MAIAKDFVFFGRLCLDFAQTGDMGYGSQFERLTSTAELQRWLRLSPLGLAKLRINAEDLKGARLLRSAIWRVTSAVVASTHADAGDVRMLNEMACQPGLVKELDSKTKLSRWHSPSIAQALATIAQDAVVLLGDPSCRARLRRCENARCKAVFYDDSRPGLRRWCAPNRCGDRIRARLYRTRQKSRRIGGR